jgi:hypothetical protein
LIIFQAFADLAEAGDQLVCGLPSGGNPDDAIRECLLHHLVVTEGLRDDGLPDSAHTFELRAFWGSKPSS